MSIHALRVSRALWAKRLRFRQRRVGHWQHLNNPAKVARWKKLAAHAASRVKRRDQQIKARTPQPGTRISERGLHLICVFEGFVDHVYRDAVGVETIGYGETRHDIINEYRGRRIPEPVARRLLKQRVDHDYAPAVLACGVPLTQHQFDALCSFVYNVGGGGLAATTTVGRLLRARDYLGAANGLLAWCRAGGRVLPGLLARRQQERSLFLS